MTLHIESKENEIEKNVLMPGDPLRAKYIAEKYLTDVKIINNIRNMTAYTGKYKGFPVTIFPSGMGMASIGIYSYELFKFYGVDNIIRIGTSGANNPNVKILDVILATESYSLSNYLNLFDGYDKNIIESSNELNNKIEKTSNKLNINLKKGIIITSDVFNPYVDSKEKYESNYENFNNTLASEMEAFALFYMAKKFGKNATCLLTITDSSYDNRKITSSEREKSLDDMIMLALESIVGDV